MRNLAISRFLKAFIAIFSSALPFFQLIKEYYIDGREVKAAVVNFQWSGVQQGKEILFVGACWCT